MQLTFNSSRDSTSLELLHGKQYDRFCAHVSRSYISLFEIFFTHPCHTYHIRIPFLFFIMRIRSEIRWNTCKLEQKGKTVKTLELLGIRGLCLIVGISENTAANWIKDFNVYIPTADQQDDTYYHPEAIEVLKFIKQCKDQNYEKPQIMEMLKNRSFPITVDSSIKDVQTTLENGNYKENILSVMQTIGMTVSNVADQEKWLKNIQEKQDRQNKRIEHAEKQAKEITDLKQEIQTLKQEITK